jgi:hypothetical protein
MAVNETKPPDAKTTVSDKNRSQTYELPKSNINVLADKRILQYPLGLGNTELDDYGQEQQYMMFKINTDEKTTALREDVKGAEVSIALGNRAGTGFASKRNVKPKAADPDMVIKYGEEAVKNTQWVSQKGMVRLDKVIVLPMPSNHRVLTQVDYSEEQQSELTRLADNLNQGPGLAKDLWRWRKNKALSKTINAAWSGATSERALLAGERLLDNPKMEVLFSGFHFREFSFQFQFAPKSQEESEVVRDIIETFRYYALPEITAGKMFYVFPSEFEIEFMQGQRNNPNIPKITTSVLKDINVDYAPFSVWSTLPNGAPLSITITLNFKELELIDRSRVYNPESVITSGY